MGRNDRTWSHSLQDQMQGKWLTQGMGANLAANHTDIKGVDAGKGYGTWELNSQEEYFHRSVGEFVKLSHDRLLAVIPWSEQMVEEDPISMVSDWVLNSIEKVSEVLGLPFEELEHMAWELFVELEKELRLT